MLFDQLLQFVSFDGRLFDITMGEARLGFQFALIFPEKDSIQ